MTTATSSTGSKGAVRRIGGWDYGWFKGDMDEVALWNRALPERTIMEHAGLTPQARLVVTVPGGPMSAFDRHIGHDKRDTMLNAIAGADRSLAQRIERADAAQIAAMIPRREPFVIEPAPPAGHWRWAEPDQLVYMLESKLPAGREYSIRPADDIESTPPVAVILMTSAPPFT